MYSTTVNRLSLLAVPLLLLSLAATGATFENSSRIVESRLGKGGALIPVVDGELLITLDKAESKALRGLLGDYYLELKSKYNQRGLYHLNLNPRKLKKIRKKFGSTDLSVIIKALRNDKRIRSVEPNAICSVSRLPGGEGRGGGDNFFKPDPSYRTQWNLWRQDMMDTNHLWPYELGESDVVIAILDSGVAYEDYRDEYHTYIKMEDYEGVVFREGYDFINDDNHPNDDYNHGTHMAGIVCAALGNGIGISGIAPRCAIMPVKILDNNGSGTVIGLIQGIDFAADNGADVINMSVSFPNGFVPGEALYQSIKDAYDKGVVLVASAGNAGLSEVCYPARFNECIAVGAVNSSVEPMERSAYSNWGPGLDVMAPGGDTEDRNGDEMPDAILSTAFAGGKPTEDIGYWLGCGTSQAAAHVSALAGLLLAFGAEDDDVVRNAICQTARDMEADGCDDYTGYGMVEPVDALLSFGNLSIEPMERMCGYVKDHMVVSMPFGYVGLILQFPDRLVYIQESPDSVCVNDSCFVETNLYAMVEWNPPSDTIAVYEIEDYNLTEILSFPEGPIDYIIGAGGIIQFLNDTGGLLQFLNDTGGLLMFLDDTGALDEVMEDYDILLILDGNGGLIQFLNDTGGLLQFLNDTGGLIMFLDDTGGIIMFLNDTGGLLGFMDMESMSYAGCMDIHGTTADPLFGTKLDELMFISPE